MEVVTIEKRTFSYVCERFTEFAKRIESLCSTHTQKVENWQDSQEVCLLLGFSKRTLQYYRSSGRLAYSQIGSKIYYKSSDIERIITGAGTARMASPIAIDVCVYAPALRTMPSQEKPAS